MPIQVLQAWTIVGAECLTYTAAAAVDERVVRLTG